MNFSSDLREIIKLSVLGNPSMLQMMLYSLLVIPKVLNNLLTNDICQKINWKVKDLEDEVLESTYTSDKNGIDYLRYIRNAV